MFFKIGALKNFALLRIGKTPTQVFPCEVYEIFKNTFFYITPPVTASAPTWLLLCFKKVIKQLFRNLAMTY